MRGEFDAVIAPYHDVGMTAIKVASFGAAVNVTLGLPFPRTSPDHGTALDIAGQGDRRPVEHEAGDVVCARIASRARGRRAACPAIWRRRALAGMQGTFCLHAESRTRCTLTSTGPHGHGESRGVSRSLSIALAITLVLLVGESVGGMALELAGAARRCRPRADRRRRADARAVRHLARAAAGQAGKDLRLPSLGDSRRAVQRDDAPHHLGAGSCSRP